MVLLGGRARKAARDDPYVDHRALSRKAPVLCYVVTSVFGGSKSLVSLYLKTLFIDAVLISFGTQCGNEYSAHQSLAHTTLLVFKKR